MRTDDKSSSQRVGAGARSPLRGVVGDSALNLAVWPVLAALILTACGDDGNGGGNEDTLLTGLSGVVILGAVIWFVLRKVRSRG